MELDLVEKLKGVNGLVKVYKKLIYQDALAGELSCGEVVSDKLSDMLKVLFL